MKSECIGSWRLQNEKKKDRKERRNEESCSRVTKIEKKIYNIFLISYYFSGTTLTLVLMRYWRWLLKAKARNPKHVEEILYLREVDLARKTFQKNKFNSGL